MAKLKKSKLIKRVINFFLNSPRVPHIQFQFSNQKIIRDYKKANTKGQKYRDYTYNLQIYKLINIQLYLN